MSDPRVRRRYITMAEAVEYTGLSARTLRTYVANGRLTGYRVGPRALRLSLAEVEDLFVPVPTVATTDGGAA